MNLPARFLDDLRALNSSQLRAAAVNAEVLRNRDDPRHGNEERARKAEELLKTALRYSDTIVWHWNIDEDKIEWSGAVKEIYGAEEFELDSWSRIQNRIYHADLAGLEEAIRSSCASGTDYHHEYRIVRSNGEIRWLVGSAGLLRNVTGRIYGMAGVNYDITIRKRTEEEMKQRERDFRELTNAIPQIVFTANTCGEIEYSNERYYGCPAPGNGAPRAAAGPS